MIDLGFGNEIESLTEYIECITNIRNNVDVAEVDRTSLFFRGQENIDWDIKPSVFRDNLLVHEAKMTHWAYSIKPLEFQDYISPFEKLTKLQHYGLSTRLLDVTTNPLVSLYFACQPCIETNEIEGSELEEKVKKDGIVFYKREYANDYDKTEVKIICSLAEMDMPYSFTIEQCLEYLEENNIITIRTANAYRKNNYKIFRDILQKNYFVKSNLTNERLIRQSGAFLLPGCFNISNSEKPKDNVIRKATGNLIGEFENDYLIIPSKCKNPILEELDFININKATLFPELEHQMDYIKNKSKSIVVNNVEDFIKINNDREEFELSYEEVNTESEILERLKTLLDKYFNNSEIKENLSDIFKINKTVDWEKRENVLSKIKKECIRYLASTPHYNHQSAKEAINKFMDELLLCVH